MHVDFSQLAQLLNQDPVVTYKMRYELFYSPLGTNGKLWYQPGGAMLMDRTIHLYGKEQVLDGFLAQLEPGREYRLFCVPVYLMPLLKQHFDIQGEEDSSAYTIDAQDFVGTEQTLDSLNLDDVDFVNDHWTYKHEGSRAFFHHVISTYPSSAIRVNGELAGWSVCYDSTPDMVNLGSLRVLDQYRRRGFGKQLALDLVQKVLDTGKTPMVHIVDDNTASKSLSMAIGFKPHSEKVFWATGIKK